MADPLRLAVVGVGALGQHHARIYSDLPGARLVGVLDLLPERAAEVAARSGSRPLSDLDEVIAEADAVSVAVPTVAHHAVARRLLEAGKHVLVEKPITTTLAEADDLIALAAERGLVGVPEGDLVIFSRGKIAHSSVPASGRNAIVEVALVGARLQSLADGAFARASRFVDERIGLSTDGSGFGLATDKPIPQASNTTASLDLVATDEAADRLDLTINYRVGIANTTREIEDKSGAIAAGYVATLREIAAERRALRGRPAETDPRGAGTPALTTPCNFLRGAWRHSAGRAQKFGKVPRPHGRIA